MATSIKPEEVIAFLTQHFSEVGKATCIVFEAMDHKQDALHWAFLGQVMIRRISIGLKLELDGGVLGIRNCEFNEVGYGVLVVMESYDSWVV